MGRHRLWRRIQKEPGVLAFKPAGIPASRLECVNLTLDELEAIRLSDIEGLYQEEAARKMQVSRQTFGRIIGSAHSKVADALVNGKVLFVKGGRVQVAQKRNQGKRCAPINEKEKRTNGENDVTQHHAKKLS